MSLADDDVEARYGRRFGAIERELPPTPPFITTTAHGGGRIARVVGLLVAAALVVAVAVPLLGLRSALQPLNSGSPGTSDRPFPTLIPIPKAPFPTQVGDLPVITVAQAVELQRAGGLDGRAVAVAGYYDAVYPSCPAPSGYVGPLERRCDLHTFADTPDEARLCETTGTSTACRLPTGTFLEPFLGPETTPSLASIFAGYDTIDPLPMVLIGHAGDPRQWLCAPAKQAECARAFVVDRVGWALGGELHIARADTTDVNGVAIAPSKTLDQIVAAAGITGQLADAAAFEAHDLASADPRWPLSGTDVVWIVRTLGPPRDDTTFLGLATRPLTVWVADDATGTLLGSRPVAAEPGERPALLWQRASVHGLACCDGPVFPHARVESASDGTVLYEGLVSGSATGDEGSISFGSATGLVPLVVPPGDYTVTVWLASSTGTEVDAASQCTLRLSVAPLESVAYFADFRLGKPCAITRVAAPLGAP